VPREIRGAIHVHSDYSDGTGSVDEIIEAAQETGLDYVILTDHDTIRAAEDGYGGRHGGVLLVVGSEISPPRRGHCLTLGSVDPTGMRWMPEKYYLHKLRRDGADVYIAHPEGRVKPAFGINLKQWHVWESEQFTGIEIWSYMHDWVENLNPLTMPYYYMNPDKAIDGPNERVLGLWDRLNLHRRVAGIGALDAHAVKMCLGAFVAFKYERLFRTILTHVTVDRWGENAEADRAELIRGLREARAYVAYDGLSPAEGFQLSTNGGLRAGDRGRLERETRIRVRVPKEAEVRLIHNGRRSAQAGGMTAEFAAEAPGVYRVEVYLGGRPWIFSNPIFLA